MEECGRVTQKTKLKFTWYLFADDFNQACEVQLLCRHAIQRGVHLPEAWKREHNQRFGMQAVDALADSAVPRAQQRFSLPGDVKLSCRLACTCACVLARVCVYVCVGGSVRVC